MSQPPLSMATLDSAARPGPADTRLHGRWLVLARVGWVAVTITVVILNLIALPDTYGSYFTFTPQALQELHRLGFSPTLYGILLIAENAPLQLVTLGLGLLIFWRRSDDRMALFCAFVLVNTLPVYNWSNGSIVPTLATNPILRVVALLLFAMGNASLVIFFYLFPSGRFAPRWTRWSALGVSAFLLAVVFFPALPARTGGPTAYIGPFFILTAAVAQVYRYRRISTPGERQQTKWVVFGFALAIALFVAYVPIGFLGPAIQFDPVLGRVIPIIPVVQLLIPTCIALAVLRAQLWDIDAIINKALVYGSLTALLAGLYAGLIIGLESLAGSIGGQTTQQPVVLVISTLAIAALFQPLRRRLQNIIDRRFYRRKYDAARTLAAFSATLRQEVDLNDLREHLLAVVTETMQPTYASLWLRPTEPSRAASSAQEQHQPLAPGGMP